MRYFREMKFSFILLFNLILGLITGWFDYQAIRLLLGQFLMTGFFWRMLGVQFAFFQFIVVYLANQSAWKRLRTKMPVVSDIPISCLKLAATILVYAAGAIVINVIICLIR